MGYTTEFQGEFLVTPALNTAHADYLKAFASTRRMKRNSTLALHDPLRDAVGLPAGEEQEYFVNGFGFMGQNHDESVVDYNLPPGNQPELWCKWAPNQAGTAIEWNGAEKFYCYTKWLRYLIDRFLAPWGYKLNGTVRWSGEEPFDTGTITVQDNNISVNASRPANG